MKYSRPISRLASSALLSAGLFVAGSISSTAPASAAPFFKQATPIKTVAPVAIASANSLFTWFLNLIRI